MVMGTYDDINQVVDMANYLENDDVTDMVEVPAVYFILPPGRWLLFHYVPFKFNFTNTSLAQVSFGMGFAPEDDSEWGTAGDTTFINGIVANNVSHREIMMGIINNTTGGNVKYTLRMGRFAFINNLGSGISVSGTMTVMPTGYGAYIYAIGVK